MVLALAATVLVTGVVVAGAHGGGPKREVIHTCVDDATGAIQIVRGHDTCDAGWSPLDWNGKGPKGPQGPPGEPGEPGVKKVEVVSASTMGLLGRSPIQATLGIGVDCPGDAIATGGGGRTAGSRNGTNLPGSGAPPLVATYPLEKNSLHDEAEPGDVATGWFAEASSLGPNAPGGFEQGQAVTVFAVCADDGQAPPDEDD
jgi:hypothetical protein